ncbi:MAG: hypothetical protein NTX01_03530 [Candidatus Omnitrophica bacterium]|nr:hypothetical protein [Candidatus Omnitrophota bacterium]
MMQKTDKINIDKIRDLYWNRQYNINQVAKRLGVSFWSLYGFMDKNNIQRRLPAEANYVVSRDKPQFKIKENLNFTEEKLKIAGIMLYWAEGTLKGQTVDFVNSNPDMIRIFLKFLRQVCGVDNRRLRLYLYTYPYLDLENTKNYWKNVAGIPLNQFTKPYVRKGNLNLSNRKLPYGLVHIRYNDKKLLIVIKSWIENYKNSILIWAGTQVAKGDRLCKRSVLSKGRMEK